MTCFHRAGSVEAAIHECLHDLADSELRHFANLTRNALYALANSRQRQRLTLEDAAALDAALLAKSLPARFGDIYAAILEAKLNGRRSNSGDIHGMLRQAEIGSGDANRILDEALKNDDVVDTREGDALASQADKNAKVWLRIRDHYAPPFEPPHEVEPAAS